jgi:uncharacterized protein
VERPILEPDQPAIPQVQTPGDEPPSEVTADEQGPQTGPLRLCAVSRVQLPVEQMIRFAAGPDGVVVPDLAQRLPGRGVWVELNRVQLGLAVKRAVFAKSMKRPVTAGPDLVERVEVLLLRRVLDALAIANKAGLVVPGFAQVDAALEAGTVAGMLHGSDAAVGGSEKLDRKFRAINDARGGTGFVVTELTIDQISLAIGRSNVVHTALITGGATTRLLDEAKRLIRFRASPSAALSALNA